MKYKVGDLAFYTSMSEKDPNPFEFGEYITLRMRYGRPFYMEEANNAGIILQCYQSGVLFLKPNRKFNTYIWQSQQTGREWILFECELTSAEDYGKIGDYATSFLSPISKRK
jgi:hypothetical protein